VATSKVSRLLPIRNELVQLEKRFQAAQNSYAELRRTCEDRVVRWEWANGSVYSLDPCFFLDRDIRVGRVSPLPPKSPANWTAYGFTSDNQLAVEREYTDSTDPEYYQDFYVNLSDRIVNYRYHFAPSHAVASCSQLVFDDITPLYFQRWGVRGWVSYAYSCTNGRVDSYVCLAKEHDDEPERQFAGQIRYKEDGIVELWEKQGGSGPALRYRGRPPQHNPFLHSKGGN
jgi:hypothetical protein